jgi:hypothetical protein
VRDFFSVCVKSEALRDLPDEDLSVLGSGGDDAIVEGVPPAMLAKLPCRVRGGFGSRYQSVSSTAAV